MAEHCARLDNRSCEHPNCDCEDLFTAPGAKDFTFGSLLCEMINGMFQKKIDSRAESAAGQMRHYYECTQCRGTDAKRPSGRPQMALIEHNPDCLLHKHLPRLQAMANKDVT